MWNYDRDCLDPSEAILTVIHAGTMLLAWLCAAAVTVVCEGGKAVREWSISAWCWVIEPVVFYGMVAITIFVLTPTVLVAIFLWAYRGMMGIPQPDVGEVGKKKRRKAA